jgi:Fe2+ transport system protein FeoA
MAAGVALLGWSQQLIGTIADARLLSPTNIRAVARVWIADNLPPGAKVAIESYAPFVDPVLFTVQGYRQMIDHNLAWYVQQDFDYLVFSEGMYGRFFREPDKYYNEISQYQELFSQCDLMRVFRDGRYEVRVYRVDPANMLVPRLFD